MFLNSTLWKTEHPNRSLHKSATSLAVVLEWVKTAYLLVHPTWNKDLVHQAEPGAKQYRVDSQSTISLVNVCMRGKTTFHKMRTTSELTQKFSQAYGLRMNSWIWLDNQMRGMNLPLISVNFLCLTICMSIFLIESFWGKVLRKPLRRVELPRQSLSVILE